MARGLLVEATWLAAHVWHYPAGLGRESVSTLGPYARQRTDDLPLASRGMLVSNMSAAVRPILLVHGIGDNRSIFTVLRRTLRRRGHGVVHAVNISPVTPLVGDIPSSARGLARHVERLRLRTGADSVQVVGHSLGGVIARYYVQRLGGDADVDSLVTLGSAHHGSRVAELLPPTPLIRQLRPGSDLLDELAAPAPGCRTRFLSVWSHLDPTMVPRQSARLEHPDLDVEHLELDHVGHLSMVAEPGVLHRIGRWLADADRSRVAA